MGDWSDFGLALVSAPAAGAVDIARKLVEARLAACAQVTERTTSIYWWKEHMEEDRERLILLKTRRTLLPAIQDLLAQIHPYEVPELTFVPLDSGSSSYLAWLRHILP